MVRPLPIRVDSNWVVNPPYKIISHRRPMELSPDIGICLRDHVITSGLSAPELTIFTDQPSMNPSHPQCRWKRARPPSNKMLSSPHSNCPNYAEFEYSPQHQLPLANRRCSTEMECSASSLCQSILGVSSRNFSSACMDER